MLSYLRIRASKQALLEALRDEPTEDRLTIVITLAFLKGRRRALADSSLNPPDLSARSPSGKRDALRRRPT